MVAHMRLWLVSAIFSLSRRPIKYSNDMVYSTLFLYFMRERNKILIL